MLGCLLTNFFRSWLTVKVQVNREPKKRREMFFYIFAMVSYDLFAFYSSLTDTYLLLSQADFTLVTLIATCLADSASTVYFCSPRPKQEQRHILSTKEELMKSAGEDKALLLPAPPTSLGARRLDARPGAGASAWFAL